MAKARAVTGLDSQAPTSKNAGMIVRARLADMYAYTAYVDDPANIHQLHDLRIAVKRVRYTLEVFAEFLPAASKEFTEELTKLQDELGALHDSEVMLALLRLLLQEAVQEEEESVETHTGQEQGLLSTDMVRALLDVEHLRTPTEKEHAGLRYFLRKQEQRRTQAYAAFYQHWEQLEKEHLREAILRMVDRSGA